MLLAGLVVQGRPGGDDGVQPLDVERLRAARALAALIPEEQLSPDYIIPSVLDKSVADAVAKAVADEAREQGIARIG